MDETGLQLEHKPRRVVVKKCLKYIHSQTRKQCGHGMSYCCWSHHVIVKGKTLRTLHGVDIGSSPPGTTWSVSEKGWTKQGIAKLWIEQTSLQNIGAARPHIMLLIHMIPIFCGIN